MRIVKALWVLVFLLPTLAVAQTTPESRFFRVERDAARQPVALQTVIARYVPASDQKGIAVDLFAAVHVGQKAYYDLLNKKFDEYDVVLYELVAQEGTKPPRGGAQQSDNPLAMLQQGMKLFLQLEHQLEVVDYQKRNFVHADLSPEGMMKAMKERGDTMTTVILGIVVDLMRKQNLEADKPGPQVPVISLDDLVNPTKLKRLMAKHFEDTGGDLGLGGTINRLLIEDRNKAAMMVLAQQLLAGKKKIAIFYGAAHMPDFDARLTKELGMKRTTSEWIDAWSLK